MKRGLAAMVFTVMVVRMLFQTGIQDGLATRLRDALEDGSILRASLDMELGPASPLSEAAPAPTPTYAATRRQHIEVRAAAPLFTEVPAPAQEEEILPEEEESDIRPMTIAGGLKVTNDTSYEIDVASLLALPLSQVLPADSPQILIIHTHGTEAYTPGANDDYVASDTGRTQDRDYNVVRVGDVLTAALEKQGLRVIHDRGIYDYPSYTGSYARSGAAVESYLSEYPDIGVVIDLHRDALGADGVIYKTVAEGAGESTAQLMLLVGTGENGLEHPDWKENLKLALAMQNVVNKKYATLARSVALKGERYNQHLTTGSLILEVGSSGNKLGEALRAVQLFADAIGPLLLSLVESGEA